MNESQQGKPCLTDEQTKAQKGGPLEQDFPEVEELGLEPLSAETLSCQASHPAPHRVVELGHQL